MLYRKPGFPEEGDVLLCTVKKIVLHSVFVTADEYQNIEGIVHISEVSPGRIRNLREFVKEGKKIFCKVLRANAQRRQLDLSLRRVSSSLRKRKSDEYKQEQKAEKLLEQLATKVGTDLATLYKDFGNKVMEEYGSLNAFFQDIIHDTADFKALKVPPKYEAALVETIKEKIKPPSVKLVRVLEISSRAPNGVEIVKGALRAAEAHALQQKYALSLLYLGAPRYRMNIEGPDYKTVEKIAQDIITVSFQYLKAHGGEGKVLD